MASIQLGGGVIDARGSIAGNTFSRARSGATLKARIKGTNPITEPQSRQRIAFDQITKLWQQGLSNSDRMAWASFAAANPVLNRFGVTVTQSAFNCFMMLNSTVLHMGGLPSATPPGSTTVAQMVSGSMTLNHVAVSVMSVTVATTGLGTDDVISFWFSPFVSQGKGFISHQLRYVMQQGADGTYSFKADWINVFGSTNFLAGMKIFCRCQVVNTTTGIRSAPLQFAQISV
jgi:hypothetical protein